MSVTFHIIGGEIEIYTENQLQNLKYNVWGICKVFRFHIFVDGLYYPKLHAKAYEQIILQWVSVWHAPHYPSC